MPIRGLDPTFVRKKLIELRRLDARLLVFGARVHRYQLRPVASEAAVVAFERRHGVVLPEEYRDFVLRIGDGGAGPGTGLVPLGAAPGAQGCVPLEAAGPHGVLAVPFRHRTAWNLPPERLRRPSVLPDSGPAEDFDAALEAAYHAPGVVDGVLPVAEHGAGTRSLLVVTGAERGRMWRDVRADRRGLVPEIDAADRHLTFGRWYGRWLRAALAEAGSRLGGTG